MPGTLERSSAWISKCHTAAKLCSVELALSHCHHGVLCVCVSNLVTKSHLHAKRLYDRVSNLQQGDTAREWCPTKLPMTWKERADHVLVPVRSQAPELARLEKPALSWQIKAKQVSAFSSRRTHSERMCRGHVDTIMCSPCCCDATARFQLQLMFDARLNFRAVIFSWPCCHV